MMLYPDVQKRAQEEIEAVLGTDQLPTFEDRPLLPYVEAVLRETLRWHPVFPLGRLISCMVCQGLTFPCDKSGLPHYTADSDVYNGHYIPKGLVFVYCITSRLTIT
jgi:cytochrome P450